MRLRFIRFYIEVGIERRGNWGRVVVLERSFLGNGYGEDRYGHWGNLPFW